MRAIAVFAVSAQEDVVLLGPGDIIGRADWAALSLEDARISEAHAMISLRGQSLKLLALRGRFRVNGKVCTEVTLLTGMVIELTDGVTLTCQEISLPQTLPGLALEGLPVIALTSTLSVYIGSPPTVKHGYRPDADMCFWSFGDSWRVVVGGQSPQPVSVGQTWRVGGRLVEVVDVPTKVAEHAITRSVLRLPLHFEVIHNLVRVTREGDESLRISGIPGRILATVLKNEHQMHWQDIVDEVWPNDMSMESALRRRFDVGVSRLRTCLRQLVAENEQLIELDGAGTLTFKLTTQDTVSVQED